MDLVITMSQDLRKDSKELEGCGRLIMSYFFICVIGSWMFSLWYFIKMDIFILYILQILNRM